MTEGNARLDAIRHGIDALDAELLELLNRRGRMVLEVASVKGGEAEPRYYRPEREATLLRRLAAMNEGPLPDAEVVRLFREIVSTCRTLEQRLVIGCATVAGACAAVGHFGGAVEVHAAPDAPAAVGAVAASRYDYAVIEFLQGGEASPEVADLSRRGLALCGEWYARDGRRFVVVGREAVPPTGDDRTSLVLAADRAADLESRCEARGLTVRSTPVAGRASSIVDVAAHVDEPPLAGLLAEGGDHAVLGAYPSARVDGGPT